MGNMIYQEVAFASQWVLGGFLGWGGGPGWVRSVQERLVGLGLNQSDHAR